MRDRVTGQLTVRITNGSINERVEGHAHFAARPPRGSIGSGGSGGFHGRISFSDRYCRAIHEKRSSGKARDARPPRKERIRA